MSHLGLPDPRTQANCARGTAAPRVFVPDSPRQNLLVAALPVEDYERLLPDLGAVSLVAGTTVFDPGRTERCAYFPVSGLVSEYYTLESGATAGFLLSGNDGAVGIAAFLGGESVPSQSLVIAPGYAYRLGVDVFKRERKRDGRLVDLMLRYTQALITQMTQTAVCNRHHTLDQQLCRWLLLSLDRISGDDLFMTQELIANMLGVRREGVTEAAFKLRKLGLISYARGHICVLDRAGLEERACECYAVVKNEYERLLPDVVAA